MSDDRITTIHEAANRIERIALSEPTNERDQALRESLAVLLAGLAAAEARATEAERENQNLRGLVAVYRPFAQREYETLTPATKIPTPPPIPNRVALGANGAYWRDFGDGLYSMCPNSADNDPVEEIAVFVPKADFDTAVARANTLAEALAYWSTMADPDEAIRMAREDLGYEGEARDD